MFVIHTQVVRPARSWAPVQFGKAHAGDYLGSAWKIFFPDHHIFYAHGNSPSVALVCLYLDVSIQLSEWESLNVHTLLVNSSGLPPVNFEGRLHVTFPIHFEACRNLACSALCSVVVMSSPIVGMCSMWHIGLFALEEFSHFEGISIFL